MDSPSARRFTKRSGSITANGAGGSSPNLHASNGTVSPPPGADPPRRLRNLPSNSSLRENSTSKLTQPPVRTAPSSPVAQESPRNRFRKDTLKGSSLALEPPAPARDTSRRNLSQPPQRAPSAQDIRAEQIIQEWDLPRKRGQTPVSEAKFYAQLEKVGAFMRMLQQKEKEDEAAKKAELDSIPGPAPVIDEDEGKPLDLLSPDYDGTRTIVVRSDILTAASSAAESVDLISFNSPQLPAKGGRFGSVSAKESPVLAAGSAGVYSPIMDNRKLRSTTIDVKYSHRSELDEIEMEMSFLLQSATNAVLNILPKNVLEEYLDILVFFGARSGLWCRHALAKFSEHLELEIIGKELARLPLHELQLEDSLEGMWVSTEKICAKMMSHITLDHLFGNLHAKVTNRSYEFIVKMVYACLPVEANGAARPDRLLAQSAEMNNKYFRFLFVDLWNLHPCLHPLIIKRLDTYLQQESVKPLIMVADLSGISPHTLTFTDGVRYLRRLQTLQRLDRLIEIPTICSIIKTSRLSGNDERIKYSHGLVNCYSELMNPGSDVQSKPEKIMSTLSHDEITHYIGVLMESYIELRGIVMYRHAILARLADYIRFNTLKETVTEALGDVRKLEVLYHFILLQTYVHNWEKFDAFNTQLATGAQLEKRLEELVAAGGREGDHARSDSRASAAPADTASNSSRANPYRNNQKGDAKSYRRPKAQAGAPPQPNGIVQPNGVAQPNGTAHLNGDAVVAESARSSGAYEHSSINSDDEQQLINPLAGSSSTYNVKGKQKSSGSLRGGSVRSNRSSHRGSEQDAHSDSDDSHDDQEYLLAKPPIYMEIVDGATSADTIASDKAPTSPSVSSALPRKKHSISSHDGEDPLAGSPPHGSTASARTGIHDAPPAYSDAFQTPMSPQSNAYRALAKALETDHPEVSAAKEEIWGDVLAIIDDHQKSRTSTAEPPKPDAFPPSPSVVISNPSNNPASRSLLPPDPSSSSSSRPYPTSSHPLSANDDHPLSTTPPPPMSPGPDYSRAEITVVRSRATTTAEQYQQTRALSPTGDLPDELRMMVAEQNQHGTFLSTQTFVVFPRKKEQASLYLREFQLHIMPTFLKAYRMENLVELPDYIEKLRFLYLEEFEFLEIPVPHLSRIFYQFAEMFFVLHYTDDVLMSSNAVWQSEELVRNIIYSLRTKWVVTPGFELLAFRRLAEYVEDERLRHIVHPLNFTDWDVLGLFLKIKHSPFVEHTEEQVKELATTIMPALLHHYPLSIVVTSDKLRAALKEFNSPEEKAYIGEFFEFGFNLTNEVFAQPQSFAAQEETFPPYLEYMLNIASLWVNVKLLVLERLRVYVQCYSTDILTKYIEQVDPSYMVLSDIDVKVLTRAQREKLCEDLSVLFCLWDFKAFYPKHSNRVDMNNTEFLQRKRALLALLWNYNEATANTDWDFKARGVHERSWSMNVWLYNWPSVQDQALLLALKQGNTPKAPEPRKYPDIMTKIKGAVRELQGNSPPQDIEMANLTENDLTDAEDFTTRSDMERQQVLVWRELEGHPGVMWAGIIYRGVRLRFLKAVDRKSIDAVMGTIGSDVPAHAMWRFTANMHDLRETVESAQVTDLKWGGLVMPIIFVVGERACPYHPEFLKLRKSFSKKQDTTLLCGATVEPIYLTPANTIGNETRLRGVPNLIASTMTLFYDTPYIQNTNRYATFLSRHMWITLHAWTLAIYGIIFVWNIVQCAFQLEADIGMYLLFGLWMVAIVFVSFFIEVSVASKSPRYLGPFHPSSASNLIVRTALLILLLFWGLGQYYYADKMVRGDAYKKCMPLGVADFAMVNFISHAHIIVKRILFNRNFHPERSV